MGGKFFHIQCCAQILDLIMKDEMDVNEQDVEKSWDNTTILRSTPKKIENFETIAHHLNFAYSKKLMIDCRSRWSIAYLMLSIAFEY